MAWAELQDRFSKTILAPLATPMDSSKTPVTKDTLQPDPILPPSKPFWRRTPSTKEKFLWFALPAIALGLEIATILTLPTPGRYRNMAEQYFPALVNSDPKK